MSQGDLGVRLAQGLGPARLLLDQRGKAKEVTRTVLTVPSLSVKAPNPSLSSFLMPTLLGSLRLFIHESIPSAYLQICVYKAPTVCQAIRQ